MSNRPKPTSITQALNEGCSLCRRIHNGPCALEDLNEVWGTDDEDERRDGKDFLRGLVEDFGLDTVLGWLVTLETETRRMQ